MHPMLYPCFNYMTSNAEFLMNKPVIEVSLLAWADAKAAARPIREAVFVKEQNVPIELEWDEWDDASIHALAKFERKNFVGTGRLLPTGPDGSARLGRMAVLSEWRGKGVGEKILD